MGKRKKVAMVLAAGLGTRLKPLTFELPKPVVPVLGRPLISYTIEFLSRHEVSDLVINLHRLPGIVKGKISDWGGFRGTIKYVIEPEILGTAGGIRNAHHHFRGAGFIIVANSDILVEFDLGKAISFHKKKKCPLTMVLFPKNGYPYTSILTDGKGHVISVGEETKGEVPYFYTGVSIIETEVISRIPPGFACLIQDLVVPLMKEGKKVGAFCTEGIFMEFGTPRDYFLNTLALLREKGTLPEPRPGTILTPPAFLSDRASVEEGARIGPDAVIEGNAIIGRGSSVERCIVWPGAHIPDDTHREGVIVTPHRIIYP